MTKTHSKLHVIIHGYIVTVRYVNIYIYYIYILLILSDIYIYILIMRIYYINPFVGI